MRTLGAVAALSALASLSVGSAGAQETHWQESLEAGLKELYRLTQMDNRLFGGRAAIREPGIVLTVQQAGIPTTDGSGIISRIGRVRSGKLVNAQTSSVGGGSIAKVGDKMYVRDISVDDDKIDVKLLTVEPVTRTEDGKTRTQSYYALVRFEFSPEFLRKASPNDVSKAIAPVLATTEQASAAKTLERGQTVGEVEALLGTPEAAARLGNRLIYSYKGIKITFTDGKVTDIQ
jgi:hypothetical protein